MTSWLTRGVCMTVLIALSGELGFGAEFDWPQWGGPTRTSVSAEKGLLTHWPEEGPRKIWMFRDCGIGYSGPSIADGRLFILGARDETEYLLCLDAVSGAEQWSVSLGPTFENRWGDGPRSTPTVDGEHVYAMSAPGNLVAVDIAQQKIRWSAQMSDFGGSVPNWGYTESPLIEGELVICTPGGDDGTLLALNKKTGEKIWQSSEITDGAQYASPIVASHNGQRQVIQLTQLHLFGVDANTGKVLWQTDWPGQTAVIPTPIYHDRHVYVTSGYGVGCQLISLDAENQVHQVYANKWVKNHHGGVVLVDGYVYGYSDRMGWVCQDWLTGETKWRDRSGLGKGAVTYADGKLYCVEEDEGIVVLANASPDGWDEISRFVLEPQTELRKPAGRIWTHPVIANGRLYLRDQDLLFCFDIAQP